MEQYTFFMNDEFRQNALRNGIEGERWLNRLPDIISDYEKKWSLQVSAPFALTYNYVAPAVQADGTNAVLKIGFPKDKEFQTEIDALEIFNGDGVEKLIEADRDQSVILIERVMPGVPLSRLENDDEATRILASVMKKIRKPLPQKHQFITVTEWSRAIPQYQERYKKTSGPLPPQLVDKAGELFDELIATSATSVLVHGDLHHDNVLSSDRIEWLAIDPKGVTAEPAYETAAMIRNPYIKMTRNPQIKDIVRKRIHTLSEELELDPRRIYKWCLAQTVLSAVWDAEDPGKRWEHTISIAQVLEDVTDFQPK